MHMSVDTKVKLSLDNVLVDMYAKHEITKTQLLYDCGAIEDFFTQQFLLSTVTAKTNHTQYWGCHICE